MTERENLELKLKLAREKWRNSAAYKELKRIANEPVKSNRVNVLENLDFDVPLSEEIVRDRRGDDDE